MLRSKLDELRFPPTFTLPLNPTMRCSGLEVHSCKVMDSKKLPLWLVFRNADPSGRPISVMFKAGDDLRQDLLTLQMLELFDSVWKSSGLDLHMLPYGCVATGEGQGMIEVVLKSDTLANITRREGGAKAAFSPEPLMAWLRKFNRTPAQVETCLWNFLLSTAGYCVATYILGIGDRHNDNIMVREDGTLFHIDFGHFLGNFKTKFGFKRETAPFIFTKMYAHMLGGPDSPIYSHFCDVACYAYNVIRRQSDLLITLFMLMLSTGIPELQRPEDITWLKSVLMPGRSDDAAAAHYRVLIKEALANRRTLLNDYVHILAHS
jgi:phosphatidylinositol-4,5-bisphosphate 3-kinase